MRRAAITMVVCLGLATGPAWAAEIRGTPGDDELSGTPRNDTLRGGPGSDQLFGGAGADSLHGGRGHDSLVGGRGDDRLFGGRGSDSLTDHLLGELSTAPGDDVLRAGRGKDFLGVTGGADRVFAGPGNDEIKTVNDGVRDLIDCGPGRDVLTYYAAGGRIGRDELDRVVDCEVVRVDGTSARSYRPAG